MLKNRISIILVVIATLSMSTIPNIKKTPLLVTQVVEKDNIKFSTRLQMFNKIKEEAIKKRVEEEKQRLRIEEENRLKEIKRLEEARQLEIESKKEHWIFEISFYDNCYSCTQNGNGQTASGEYTQEGVTIAMPSDIPFGTKVYIEGLGWRTAQDVGGFIQYTTDNEGNRVMRVDVYVGSHERALELGRYYANGYIIRD